MSLHLPSQFFRFCVVGTIGFVVDAGSLYAIMWLFNWGPYSSRLPSFLLAATATWFLNQSYTFTYTRTESVFREWSRYVGYASIGGSLNYAVYVLCLLASDVARDHPIIGVAAGSIAGLMFNFSASRHLVFRSVKSSAGEETI
ncbi:MAG: GtrA family protein [Pseudomonadota bacterium]|nr:GtrA family protein [Pseudomonadota bacterium]